MFSSYVLLHMCCINKLDDLKVKVTKTLVGYVLKAKTNLYWYFIPIISFHLFWRPVACVYIDINHRVYTKNGGTLLYNVVHLNRLSGGEDLMTS